MRIIFATGNMGKLREAQEILGDGYQLVTPKDMGIFDEVEETGLTLKENSIIKAEFLYNRTGENCFADDTGLEVDCLDGAPGVYTARYAGGDGHDFDANMAKLLAEMAAKGPDAVRSARFRSVVTLIIDGEKHFFEGTLEGRIATAKSGTKGFGYDPVFIPDAYPDKTLAEISLKQKDDISHRGQALRAMARWLETR